MGTRADFYIGRGKDAEWLGSIAWDGYPIGLPASLLKSSDEPAYRHRIARLLAGRKDGTLPKDGWPWPWEDSQTTDYAYAFDGGTVYGSCFGSAWFDASKPEPEEHPDEKTAQFPDMTHRKNVAYGARSGLLIIGTPKAGTQ